MSAPAKVYVTNSELGTVRQCEKRWDFGYRQLLEPRATARPLNVGSAVHIGIASLYRYVQHSQRHGRATWSFDENSSRRALRKARAAMASEINKRIANAHEGLFGIEEERAQEMRDESEASIAEAVDALSLFVEHILARDLETYEIIGVEEPFEVVVPNEHGTDRSRVRLRGRWDLVMRDWKTGHVVFGEHKTTAGYAYDSDFRLDVDPQLRAYGFALRSVYGAQAVGVPSVMLNVVRKSAPKHPSVNKDGTVSTAAVDTIRFMYEGAVAAQDTPDWLTEKRAAYFNLPEGKKRDGLFERLQKSEKRWVDLLDKQEQRMEQLPTSADRWAFRAEHIVELHQIEEWRLDVHSTVRHQLRDLTAGRRPAVRNGNSCLSRMRPCPYRTVCVDESAERQSLYAARVHRHAEALDDPDRAE